MPAQKVCALPGTKNEGDFGRHLGLLWDDPARRPPDSVYEYEQPA